jgi:hypothetical protein
MSQGQSTTGATVYEIRIQEHLDERWADWFEGMTFGHQPGGATILWGPVADRAALHGLLNGIRDPGLSLVSVQRAAAAAAPSTPIARTIGQNAHQEETP